jgi:DNA-binding transcriptional ArsR family regulator
VTTTQNPGRQTRPNGTNGHARPVGLVRPGIAAASLPTVEMDSRTIADFLNSVCPECGEPSDLLPEDQEWLKKAREDVVVKLGQDSVAVTSLEFVMELGRIAVLDPRIKTPADLVATIDGMSDAEILDVLMAELLASVDFGEVARRAVDGDEAAWVELKTQLHGHKGRDVVTGSLQDLPKASRQAIHAWLAQYREVEDRVGRMLERDVAGRSTEEAEQDPLGFVERTTNGIRVTPERQLRTIHLIGSYFGRPYNSVTRIGDTLVICYPISDAAVGSSSKVTPPAATIRLYRALGDETRLRILRLLVDQDRYLTELANELELSKPTMSHHLAHLRSAGLVTVVEEGNLTYYSLRRDRVAQAGPELSSFLAK